MNEWPVIAQAHLIVGTLSIVAGFLSMLFRKGSRLHRIAGKGFFYSMLILCFSGFYLSASRSLQFTFFLAFFSTYLLLTGWYAISRKHTTITVFDRFGFFAVSAIGLLALVIASIGWIFGLKHPPTEPPYPAYFLFVVFACLLAYEDYKLNKPAGITGINRLVRHLWRMSFSMLIATTIFFQGNSNILPEAFRNQIILVLPIILVTSFMVFWLIYIRLKAPRFAFK